MNDAQDEHVLLVVHKHWASLALDALYVLFPGALVACVVLFSRTQATEAGIAIHAILTLLVPLTFLIVWIMLAALWTMYYLDTLVVTDRRIFYSAQLSLVSRTLVEWPIDGARVAIRISGALQSLFHYGTLVVQAPGEEPGVIPDLPDPEAVSAVILKQDDRFVQLEDTTRRQEELLKFLSHEVKGHLTKSKAAFAAIIEGDFGPVAPPLNTLAHSAYEDSKKGVDTVMNILEGADLSRGELHIELKPFDLAETVRRSVEEFRGAAAAKKLSLVSSVDGPCVIQGDEEKIARHVLRNFIDNAVRYTRAGQIDVMLEKMNGMARITVADTGVGMGQKDMASLFTEGGHGEHSREVNPDSTGYGLFVAKQIVDKHGGRIWARSAGAGSGSTFFAEFPLTAA